MTNFFWIGYHFEELRSQVAIRKKKLVLHLVNKEGINVKEYNTTFLYGTPNLSLWKKK